MPTALLDSVPDASGSGTPGNSIDFLLHVAALLGGAATNIAVGMNTTLGKAFAEHRILAALTMQGVGLPALLPGGAGQRGLLGPPATRCRVAPGGPLLDHLGLLGFEQRDATLSRIGGCALLIAGTVMVARG